MEGHWQVQIGKIWKPLQRHISLRLDIAVAHGEQENFEMDGKVMNVQALTFVKAKNEPQCQIRRVPGLPFVDPIYDDPRWFFLNDEEGFEPYPLNVSIAIEKSYQEYLGGGPASLYGQVGGSTLVISFDDLKQWDEDSPGSQKYVLRASGEKTIMEYDYYTQYSYLPGTEDTPRWYVNREAGPAMFHMETSLQVEEAYQLWKMCLYRNYQVGFNIKYANINGVIDFDNRTCAFPNATRGLLRVPEMKTPKYDDAIPLDVLRYTQQLCDQDRKISEAEYVHVSWFWRLDDKWVVPFAPQDCLSIEAAYHKPGLLSRLTGTVTVQVTFGEISVSFREMRMKGKPEIILDRLLKAEELPDVNSS